MSYGKNEKCQSNDTDAYVDAENLFLREGNDKGIYPTLYLGEYRHQARCPIPGAELEEFANTEKADNCHNWGVQYIVGNSQYPIWQNVFRQ